MFLAAATIVLAQAAAPPAGAGTPPPPPTPASPPRAPSPPPRPVERVPTQGLVDGDPSAGLDIPLRAGDAGGPPRQPPFSLGAGYIRQFSAGTEGGGTMAVDRAYASFSSRMITSDDFTLTLAMGYEYGGYHWSGTSSLGTAAPWGGVNLLGVQLRGAFRLSPEWMLSAGGIFAMAGESDADAGSSLYGGGLASISYAPNQDMILGIGVLGVTQIENNPIVIPIPVVHWRFAPEWVVSTIRRPPASPFVGIDVAWEPEGSTFDVALGVGWQQRRFRLGANADPTINNGVGLDQSWAMFVSVGADLAPGLRIDGLVGCQFLEYLELQDSQGNAQRNATVDPNALLGVFVTWSF